MERPNDSGFYHHVKTEKFYSENCIAEIWLDGESSVKNRVDFKYTIKDDGYADVIVTQIHEEHFLGNASDLRADILVAIVDRIDRKINAISWQ